MPAQLTMQVESDVAVFGEEYQDVSLPSAQEQSQVSAELFAQNKSNVDRPITWVDPEVTEGDATLTNISYKIERPNGTLHTADVESGVSVPPQHKVVCSFTINTPDLPTGSGMQQQRVVWSAQVTPL